jgi:hypothetical protein
LYGCFRDFLRHVQEVPCLLDHKASKRYGTAALREDERGVRFVVAGQPLPPGCRGCSIEFAPKRWRYGPERADVLEADLVEVTLCVRSIPVYPHLTKYLKETE